MSHCSHPPVFRGLIWEGAAPANSSTNIFTTSFSPRAVVASATYRLTIILDTTSVVNVVYTAGATTNVAALNDGTALTAARVYQFTVTAPKFSNSPNTNPVAMTTNYRLATVGTIPLFMVEEIVEGQI
jgi:hypothetical protein